MSGSRTDGAIAVVIPVYQQFHYLGRCLDSVIPQLRPGDCVAVVCEHEEFQALQEFQAAYPWSRPSYFVSDRGERWGISRARNEGVKRTDCEWIKFLDADDVLAPFALDTFRRVAMPSQIQAVAGDMLKVVNGAVQEGCYRTHWQAIARVNPSLVSANFIRRSGFDAVGGFDTGIGFEEDWDLWLRLRGQFTLSAFATLPYPTCYYWIHETERGLKVRDHTVEWPEEGQAPQRIDVREYFRRKYGVNPA